jgi:hypothetical protein
MHQFLSIVIFAYLLCGSVLTARAEDQGYRKWKSKSGSSVTAKFVKRTGDRVHLRRANGKVVSAPVSGLSAADQKWLTTNAPKNEAAALPGASPTDVTVRGKLTAAGERFPVGDTVIFQSPNHPNTAIIYFYGFKLTDGDRRRLDTHGMGLGTTMITSRDRYDSANWERSYCSIWLRFRRGAHSQTWKDAEARSIVQQATLQRSADAKSASFSLSTSHAAKVDGRPVEWSFTIRGGMMFPQPLYKRLEAGPKGKIMLADGKAIPFAAPRTLITAPPSGLGMLTIVDGDGNSTDHPFGTVKSITFDKVGDAALELLYDVEATAVMRDGSSHGFRLDKLFSADVLTAHPTLGLPERLTIAAGRGSKQHIKAIVFE